MAPGSVQALQAQWLLTLSMGPRIDSFTRRDVLATAMSAQSEGSKWSCTALNRAALGRGRSEPESRQAEDQRKGLGQLDRLDKMLSAHSAK
jgi:hypothetical protein